MTQRMKGNIMLIITAFIWGASFVAQKQGADHLGAFGYNLSRNIVAAIFLFVLIKLWPVIMKRPMEKETEKMKDMTLKGGIACGIVLTAAMGFQQLGIAYTTAGKSGFITSLYIVLVPLAGIFIGKKIPLRLWICVIMAAVGLYLLSIKGGFTISKGDFLILICAFCYAGHILVIDHYISEANGVKMSMIQFIVAAIVSGIIVLIAREPFSFEQVKQGIIPILYAGLMSSGVGYTFQIIAQRYTEATTASLIMSLESVFSVIAGAIILGESLTARELIGCIIMFIAIILAQIPPKEERMKEAK